MKIYLQILPLFLFISFTSIAQQKPWIDFNKNGNKDIYEDPESTIENRVNDLLSQMTIDEKMAILNETAPAINRLGIMKYYHGNEALHGVVRPGKFTVFPQAIGLAATWNPELIYRLSSAISDEARARWNELEQGKNQHAQFSDLLAFWSPTVNMARDPRWGRTPETYGEDPYLSARIGVSFVKGLQGDDSRYLKVVSTPKHFAGNNEEHNRFECKAIMSERALRSYYLPAFKALITEGKAESIMTAYNAINGIPCTANKWLLTNILRNEWGFNGYIVSDCGAPGFLFTPHQYAPTREDAAAMAIKAGLDLECSGYCNDCMIYRDFLPKAYKMGKITESEIDHAAFRVLRARFKLGIFDDSSLNPYSSISHKTIGSPEHKQLALETARQSIVLLKNSHDLLPLNIQKIKSIAVFGINATTCELGDYSGTPFNESVSPLQGIINKAGQHVKINTLPWEGKLSQYDIIPSEFYKHESEGILNKGLRAEYYSNGDFTRTPTIEIVENILFDPANQPPNPTIPANVTSIRWIGVLAPQKTGTYTFGIKNSGDCKFYINEKLVIENRENDLEKDGVSLLLEAGKHYSIKVEYVNKGDKSYCTIMWKTPDNTGKDQYQQEKLMARNSDVAIVVLGVNKSIEMEGRDRTTLDLPSDQQHFIQEIYKANQNTIVVLIAGSSMAMSWIQDYIPAIVNAWYPGEQGGNAIADVLFGEYNPAGRLPLTYYNSTDDLPAFDDYHVFNGRTYMYFEKKPLYAFGHGLSYTAFNYKNLQLDRSSIHPNDTISISLEIQNTGKFDGDEVAQIYLKHPTSPFKLPLKQLASFKRVHIKKGETQTIHFTLSRKDLSVWNEQNEFILPSGQFIIKVGSSSDDIRQETTFLVTE